MEACDASLADAMVAMLDWQDGGRIVREPGVLFAVGKSRYPTLYANAAFAVDPGVEPHRLLARAEEIFPDRRYIVWSRGRDGGKTGRLCEERGFLSLGDTPAMVIESRVTPSAAPGVEVTRARDAAGFADFVEISKRAYLEAGLPEGVADRVLSNADAALRSATIAVARIDGRAVASAAAITNPGTGVSGLYWVGTLPDARRRGAADAVTRFVTNAAFDDGARIVTLQASAAGEPVYLRIGYREVGRYARHLAPPREAPAS